MKKKTIGYGFKLASESWEYALSIYEKGFQKSRKEVLVDIKHGKKTGDIGRTAKPRVFKVVVELE